MTSSLRYVSSVTAGAIAAVVSMAAPNYAGTVTFGSGANQFTMDFVTIGDPGNAADTSGDPNPAGRVNYIYDIGKFEVSEDMITKYNANFGTYNNLVITKDSRGINKPATGISWNEAARFVNWLNTSTGNQAAYKFTSSDIIANIDLWTSGDAGYDPFNPYRNSLAEYYLPSYNEWYKAAYYDPTNSTYFDYANGSDIAPTAVASGTAAGTAVYQQAFAIGPAEVTQAGGLSPYGVMGLGGNVYEWEETSDDLTNSNVSSARGNRGGFWNNNSSSLSSTARPTILPSKGTNITGFRIASLLHLVPPLQSPDPCPCLVPPQASAGVAVCADVFGGIQMPCLSESNSMYSPRPM
jgi:hypothetical protein